MAVTVTNYARFNECMLEGRVNLASDEFWAMLVTSAYVFNQHSHKFKSAVSGELIGSGYTAGGKKIILAATVYDSVTKTVSVPAGNISWPSVSFTGATGAVIYVKRSGIANNATPLVSYVSFGESINRNDQAFYINMPASGALKLSVP